MKTYTVLYAEDVPHYAAVEIEAVDTVDAIAKAQNFDLTGVPTNPGLAQRRRPPHRRSHRRRREHRLRVHTARWPPALSSLAGGSHDNHRPFRAD